MQLKNVFSISGKSKENTVTDVVTDVKDLN
jgi:hypothetical protein